MSNNFWNDEEFSENPVQYTGNGKGDSAWSQTETYAPVPETELKAIQLARQAQQEVNKKEMDIEQLTEEMAQEEEYEEDFTEVLSDARLRLEQGRLYEMVMQHDLFKDLDADPRAVKSVQNQIRRFAKERMEIMLGIKKEATISERLEIDFPFNQLEVEVLKRLAHKVTDGATENSDNYVPEVKKVREEVPTVPKKQSLNAIGTYKSKKTVAPPEAPKKSVKQPEPFKRQVKPKQPEVNQEGVLTGKSLSEMTDGERLEKYKETIERQKRMKVDIPKDQKTPWPSQEQQEMLAIQQASRASRGFVESLNKNLSSSQSLKSVIQSRINRG
jgi:hypothetical protein